MSLAFIERRIELTENLILKTFEGNHEVQQSHFDGSFRQIMRITQFGRHVEAEETVGEGRWRAKVNLPEIGRIFNH